MANKTDTCKKKNGSRVKKFKTFTALDNLKLDLKQEKTMIYIAILCFTCNGICTYAVNCIIFILLSTEKIIRPKVQDIFWG